MHRHCPSEIPTPAPALLTHSLRAGQSHSSPAWPELIVLQGKAGLSPPAGTELSRMPCYGCLREQGSSGQSTVGADMPISGKARESPSSPLTWLCHLCFTSLSSFSHPACVQSLAIHAWHSLVLALMLIIESDRNTSYPWLLAVLCLLLREHWPRKKIPDKVLITLPNPMHYPSLSFCCCVFY